MAIFARNAEHVIMPAVLVEQRQTERREITHSAVVTLVGTPAGVLHGEIRNLSERGTQIRLSEPVPPFTLVRIEYDDNLVLGEVVYCLREDASWLAGLRIEHALFRLTSLSETMQAL
jgi:hypothetical protein